MAVARLEVGRERFGIELLADRLAFIVEPEGGVGHEGAACQDGEVDLGDRPF